MDLSKKITTDTKKIYTSILNYSLIIILLSISIWIPFRGYFLGIVLLIPLIDLNKKILTYTFLLLILLSIQVSVSLLVYNPSLFEYFRYIIFIYFLFIINNLRDLYLDKTILKNGIFLALAVCIINVIYYLLTNKQITFIEKGPLGQYIALCLTLLYLLERNKIALYVSLFLNIVITSLRGFGVTLILLFLELRAAYKIILSVLLMSVLLIEPNFIGIQARLDTALSAIFQERNDFVGRYAALYMLSEYFTYDSMKILFGYGAGSYNDLRSLNMTSYLDYDYPGIIIIELIISLGLVGTLLFILLFLDIIKYKVSAIWILFSSLAASVHDPMFWISSIIILFVEKNTQVQN